MYDWGKKLWGDNGMLENKSPADIGRVTCQKIPKWKRNIPENKGGQKKCKMGGNSNQRQKKQHLRQKTGEQ